MFKPIEGGIGIMGSTLDLFLKRRSCRKFTDEEISGEIIQELLMAAMAAPSACNKCPWEFYVIKNPEIQAEVKKASRFASYNSKLIIIVCGNTQRSLSKKVNDYWIQDCSAAVENMLLAATSLGLGSCWCGLSPMELPVQKVREVLHLDEEEIPMALIHLGYPAEELDARTQYNEEYVHIIE